MTSKKIKIEKKGKGEWELTVSSKKKLYSSKLEALVEARWLARSSGATVLVSEKPVRMFYAAHGKGTLGLTDKAIREAVGSVIAERKRAKPSQNNRSSKRAHHATSSPRKSHSHASL